MKKHLIFTIVLITYLNSYAQSSFQKGFFINNYGEKIECLIENKDLFNNPKSFSYKLSAKSEKIKATIDDVKVFEIYNKSKYERHTVKIDRSSEIIDQVSTTRQVKFNEEILFLKVLVEGKASLYRYSEPNLLRFFYKKNTTSEIEQLVFKSYYSEGFSLNLKKNEQYKQQLLNNLKCDKIKVGRLKNLKYRQSDLINIFVLYNTCVNSEMINYTLRKSKAIFNVNIKSGINFSSFFLGNNVALRNLYFDNKQTLRLGFELEYLMPFNNNKWGLIVEPTYNSFYKDSEEDTIARETTIEYSAIEIPLGIRHYIFLNNDSSLFMNASFVFDFPLNSKLTGENNFDISSSLNYSLGVGYKFKDKVSIEFRTFTKRDLLGYSTKIGDFKSSSLILGYTLF